MEENKNSNKTVLSEVFYMFCDIDENMIPVFSNPFEINGTTYATDRFSLVYCDSNIIDFHYENKETPPNVNNIIPEINTSEIINIDSIDWLSLMTQNETTSVGSYVDCGHCDGFGTYEDSFFYKHKLYDYHYKCPVCEGTGHEQTPKIILTGNKTFKDKDVIKFKDAYFSAFNFYKLKKVKDLIGMDIELISYRSNDKALLFKIGFLNVLLMPILFHSIYEEDVLLCIN